MKVTGNELHDLVISFREIMDSNYENVPSKLLVPFVANYRMLETKYRVFEEAERALMLTNRINEIENIKNSLVDINLIKVNESEIQNESIPLKLAELFQYFIVYDRVEGE